MESTSSGKRSIGSVACECGWWLQLSVNPDEDVDVILKERLLGHQERNHWAKEAT